MKQTPSYYVCTELVDLGGFRMCKTWQEMPPSALDQLAITKDEAIELSLVIASIFVLVMLYKVAAKTLNKI